MQPLFDFSEGIIDLRWLKTGNYLNGFCKYETTIFSVGGLVIKKQDEVLLFS